MSKLLEQAIVDAKALREAAMKSAESVVLEKYADEVKTAISSLLERDEEELEMGEEVGDEEAVEDQVPLAAEDDKSTRAKEVVAQAKDALDSAEEAVSDASELLADPDLRAKLDDDEDIEIDFDELEKQMKDGTEGDEELDRENSLMEEKGEDKYCKLCKEKINQDDQRWLGKHADKCRECAVEEKGGMEKIVSDIKKDKVDEEIDEDVLASLVKEVMDELNEEDLEEDCEDCPDKKEEDKLEEDLTVDVQPFDANGKYGSNPTDKEELNDLRLAAERDSENAEENKQLRKAVKELQEDLNKTKEITYKFKDKLEEVLLTNARLFYKNSALSSENLNERQKNKIVESLDKAKTVEEVKSLYETLQGAVGGMTRSNKKDRPKSLREVKSRNDSSTILPARTNNNKKELNKNPLGETADRVLKLAGLSKK